MYWSSQSTPERRHSRRAHDLARPGMTVIGMQPPADNHLAVKAMDAWAGKYQDCRLLLTRSEWSVAMGVLIAVVVIVVLLALLWFGLSPLRGDARRVVSPSSRATGFAMRADTR
jgi:hypothetical protein